MIVSPNAYFPSLSASSPVTDFSILTFSTGSSVVVVTSFDGSPLSDVATFTTFLAAISASVTTCVNVKSSCPFTAIVPVVFVFSSDTGSFTTTPLTV